MPSGRRAPRPETLKARRMTVQPKPLPVWDRDANRLVEEFLDDHVPTYETRPRLSLTQRIQATPLYDRLYSLLQQTRWSARKIGPYIQKHHIRMDEFVKRDYRSFEDFFVREFRPGVRRFPTAPGEMGAFAEARYLAWEKLTPDHEFPVKGSSADAERVLGSAERARPFLGGPVILARLAPVDYHHVHYPDAGRTLDTDRLGSHNFTVTWQALLNKDDIILRNERAVSILETEHFGRLGFVEVGALTVGRIAQIHPANEPFTRGLRKSVFRFGGSAILVFGEPGAWLPSQDLLEHTREGVETMLRLGQTVATRTEGQS